MRCAGATGGGGAVGIGERGGVARGAGAGGIGGGALRAGSGDWWFLLVLLEEGFALGEGDVIFGFFGQS